MVTIRCGNQEFSNIQAIIFDKDGTLEDSQNFLREIGIKRARLIDAQIPGIGEPLLMAFGIQNDRLDPTGLIAVGSRQENEIAAAAYIAETGRGWFEALAIAQKSFTEADRYLERNATTSPLFTGCLEILKFLSDAGIKLGILSSDSTANIKTFIQRYQLSDYISMAIGADRGLTKPNPELFIKACQVLGVTPDVTLMIGDSQGDINMAKGAGAIGVIGICWGKPEATHLKKADVTIFGLDQLQILGM